ncbi:MAG TPA: penicillin acylase family protein, partial [Candidatus Acidoferrales bacterium]
MRLLRYAALLILLLIVLGAIAGWWIFFRTLPQLAGAISLPELKQDVTVERDAWGVPRIRAASLEDLVTAQGYIVAQDRLWQMDLLRRVAAGELSEIFGPATIATDRQNRTLGFRRVAEQTLETLSAEERLLLDAYARGVNRFIEDHAGKLPWEFTVLRYHPRPWQPTDTLLVGAYMYETLTSTWPAELNRATVTEKVGPELARDLFTVDSPLDRFIVGGEATGPTRASLSPPSRVDSGHALASIREQVEAMFGNNNWVVSGAHTYSGKPLLANDTHLPLQVPSIYYTIHLTAPGWDVKGFTLPGSPLVVIGHNQRIAWGFTNNGADVQDLYTIHFSATNPDEYRYNGQMLRAERRFEAIRVRGQDDVSHEVVVTRHGPIVERDASRAYALRWTALEPRGLRITYWLLGRAQNWEEFRDILRQSGGPAQNVVYADVDGNIGFAVGALVPVRKQGDGSVPVPGDTDAHEWTGYIPFDELPHILNPPGGIIATANARVVGPGYRWYLTDRWGSAHRTSRIYELLESGKKFRPQDFLAIQTDIVSLSHSA